MDNPPFKSLADLGRLFQIPPTDSASSYFESLGRFIAAYAVAEAAVHELARSLSKLPEAKARVIFAGMRLSDLADRIRAMQRIDSNEGETLEVESCLVQLDAIADMRNKLVHRYVSYQFGQLVVSNMFTAKSREGIQHEFLTRPDLDNMAADCRRIFVRLVNLADGKKHPPEEEAVLRLPWQYKPAQPTPEGKSPRTGRKERRPQPRS
jgi:hypothetical protein